jgi:hypothetical protein
MRKRRIYLWIGVISALLLLAAYYYHVTPDKDFMPQCIFKRLTGWQCPGCGSQRMAHALLHGNVAEALRYNYFMPIFLILLALTAWMDTICRKNPALFRKLYKLNIPLVIIILTATWTVVRNILNI